ncbi:putative lipid II flippase FtsW [Candidatus Poribacteria bacterium]|nr:putative lipid II flippase FtsW [Candidatus Poribacteria bacterium]
MNRLIQRIHASTEELYPLHKRRIDHFLFFTTLCLVAIGFVMVYSASSKLSYELYNENSYRYLKVQLVACALGLISMIAASYFPYRYYEKYAKQILLFSIFALLLVYTPLGYSVRSETGKQFHRWIRIAGVQFQPVEFVKIGLVIYVSHFLSHKQDKKIRSLTQGMLPNMLVLFVIFVLLYKQPDFGSAVLLSSAVVVLLFVGGARPSQIILLMGIACFFIYVSIQGDAYKMQRVQDFMASMKSSSYEANHQVTRSLNALALGGLLGAGIGNSIYKLFYLPYPHTDFIFAILGEELGFIGGVGVIILFMLLIWRGIHIALRVTDSFASLLAVGITMLIGLQTVVNIGVVTGMLPTKGITLPFISYGGSSLLFSLVNIGILLNISRGRSQEVK